jgi:hypothetical protein
LLPPGSARRACPPRSRRRGAKDDVVPGQWHDVEVGRERVTVNEQGRIADDADAGDPLAIGDQGGEAGPLAEL